MPRHPRRGPPAPPAPPHPGFEPTHQELADMLEDRFDQVFRELEDIKRRLG